MKKVPLKDLKTNLAAVAEEVAKGNPIEVTKYTRPYLRMVPSGFPYIHYGRLVGQGMLEPALSKEKTKGRFLTILLEDREE